MCVYVQLYTSPASLQHSAHGRNKMGAARPGNFSLSAVDLISTWPVGRYLQYAYSVYYIARVSISLYYVFRTVSTHALLNPTVYRTASLSLRMDRRDNNNDVRTCIGTYLVCVRCIVSQ